MCTQSRMGLLLRDLSRAHDVQQGIAAAAKKKYENRAQLMEVWLRATTRIVDFHFRRRDLRRKIRRRELIQEPTKGSRVRSTLKTSGNQMCHRSIRQDLVGTITGILDFNMMRRGLKEETRRPGLKKAPSRVLYARKKCLNQVFTCMHSGNQMGHRSIRQDLVRAMLRICQFQSVRRGTKEETRRQELKQSPNQVFYVRKKRQVVVSLSTKKEHGFGCSHKSS